MGKKGVKFSKQHLANLRAAHAKRRKKPPSKIVAGLVEAIKNYDPTFAIDNAVIVNRTTGLIDRMTQAIDKIQTQIERLESL